MAGQKSTTTDTSPDFRGCELLTIQEFAEQMKVCSNTVREWINSGDLVEGHHFVKIRSVIRFPWPEILSIICKSALASKKKQKPSPHVTTSLPKHRTSIDLSY